MIIYLAPKVTDRSLCSLPAALRKRQKGCLFEIAPGRVYRSRSLSKSKVGSYPAISPLPRRISPTRRYPFCCTFHILSLKFLSKKKFRELPGPVFPGVRTFLTLLVSQKQRDHPAECLISTILRRLRQNEKKKKESQNLLKIWYATCIYLCKKTGVEVIR